jgi:hypothetical protein
MVRMDFFLVRQTGINLSPEKAVLRQRKHARKTLEWHGEAML